MEKAYIIEVLEEVKNAVVVHAMGLGHYTPEE